VVILVFNHYAFASKIRLHFILRRPCYIAITHLSTE